MRRCGTALATRSASCDGLATTSLTMGLPPPLHRSFQKQHPPNQYTINTRPINTQSSNVHSINTQSTPNQYSIDTQSTPNQHSINTQSQFIETNSFGSIFSRCSGDPADPLILFVHGAAGGRAKLRRRNLCTFLAPVFEKPRANFKQHNRTTEVCRCKCRLIDTINNIPEIS